MDYPAHVAAALTEVSKTIVRYTEVLEQHPKYTAQRAAAERIAAAWLKRIAERSRT